MLTVFLDITNDLDSIKNEALVLKRKKALLQKTKDPDIADSHIRAMSGCVHGIYTGIENVLQELIKYFDKTLPAGEDWHIKLLERSSIANPGIRPAIISKTTKDALDELRAFRHIFRGKYHSLLIPQKVVDRAEAAIKIIPLFMEEIDIFKRTDEISHSPSDVVARKR